MENPRKIPLAQIDVHEMKKTAEFILERKY